MSELQLPAPDGCRSSPRASARAGDVAARAAGARAVAQGARAARARRSRSASGSCRRRTRSTPSRSRPRRWRCWWWRGRWRRAWASGCPRRSPTSRTRAGATSCAGPPRLSPSACSATSCSSWSRSGSRRRRSGAVNMLAPLLLAGVALYSCFPNRFRQHDARAPAHPDDLLLVGPVRRAGAGGGGRDVRVAAAVGGARGRRRVARVQPGDLARAARRRASAGSSWARARWSRRWSCALAAPLLPPVPVACTRIGDRDRHRTTARSKARPIAFRPAPSASTPGSPSTCRATTARGSASSGIATASRWATSPPARSSAGASRVTGRRRQQRHPNRARGE